MRMRKWYGGVLIIALTVILLLQYTLMGNSPQKQPPHAFGNHPANSSELNVSGSVSLVKEKKVVNHREEAHLVAVDGLDDLYVLNNISKEDSNALLVWAHMYPLLSRSDALPETAQGIKEASSAWKDLWSAIEEDKAAKFNNTNSESGNQELKDCPFSVSTFNKTVYSSGCILEFPCGLVEDSSITVIGIPDGHNGSFQVEFVGSQLPGEREPPVVLHYNVSLPGDKLTEEPMIVQNTWINETGWGMEERCHAHASTNIQKGAFHFLSRTIFVFFCVQLHWRVYSAHYTF